MALPPTKAEDQQNQVVTSSSKVLSKKQNRFISEFRKKFRMCLVGDSDCMGCGQPYFAGPPHSSECLVVWLERIEFRDWFPEWE
jgi:hypothetical protein